MIVVDTSAVIAILRKEAGFEQFVAAIDADDALIMSNANYLELAIVLLRRYGREGLTGSTAFLRRFRSSFATSTVSSCGSPSKPMRGSDAVRASRRP